ncbi:four helix bundle protein [Candidatus Kuenenbacteria bacterium]|nr:four helix bundle protein [Candidatus Kuenenbacteria bacterium]
MSNIKNFYDLDAWQQGHALVLMVYRSTQDFPKDEIYGVTSQLRRATASITANIAEGFARYHFKDKIKFYYQARGSVAETQNFLFLVKDLGYISSEQFQIIGSKTKDVYQLINGLIRSTENQINPSTKITNY